MAAAVSPESAASTGASTAMGQARVPEIDGVRGWAALCVLLFHVFGEMLGGLYPGVHSDWIAPFLNGDLAVLIFFVLSGDALSTPYFAAGANSNRPLDKLIVKRYVRLTLPILMACALVYLVMRMGLDLHVPASHVAHNEPWLGEFLRFEPSLAGLLKYALVDVYVNHTSSRSYGPFLWTMSVEMLGSMLVFLSCYLWRGLARPSLVVAVVAGYLLACGSPLSLFLIGVVFAHLRQQGVLDRIRRQRFVRWGTVAASIVIYLLLVATNHVHMPRHFDMALAIALVGSVYVNDGFRAFFSTGFSRFLGEISFPLYLTHFAVLISVMSSLIMAADRHARPWDAQTLLGIAVPVIAVCLVVATVFRAVERSVLRRVDSSLLRVLA